MNLQYLELEKLNNLYLLDKIIAKIKRNLIRKEYNKIKCRQARIRRKQHIFKQMEKSIKKFMIYALKMILNLKFV